jgi:hypothetical protein
MEKAYINVFVKLEGNIPFEKPCVEGRIIYEFSLKV